MSEKKMENNNKKIAFVICPLNEPESDIRKRSDQILKHIIAPIVEDLGYEVVRSDTEAVPGTINVQIITHLINDALVVADLTDYNPNVFYELGIRHAFRKPVVQIIEEGQEIPFNVAGLRTIKIITKSFVCRGRFSRQYSSKFGDSEKWDSRTESHSKSS